MNKQYDKEKLNALLVKVFTKAAEDYRASGGDFRDVLKGDMKAKVREFNVLQTNTQSVNRTELISKLSKEEQIMFNKFVKSVNSK